MPCRDALMENVLTLKTGQKVEEALKAFHKKQTNFAPVLDEEGNFVGVFSISRLLYDVLPVSVSVGREGFEQNIKIPAAPGMAKRLAKDKTSLVSELMERNVPAVSPDAPLEVAIRQIRDRGEPVVVVDETSGAFKGILTDQSVMAALANMAS